MKLVKKAVIAAGGLGMRFRPITRTMSKCMLPILNRPIIDYLVEECSRAGVEDVAIVTPSGTLGLQVAQYFHRASGSADLPRLTFIEQPLSGPYGSAIPIVLAQPFLGDDHFYLLNGDDLFLRFDGGSNLIDMSEAQKMSGAVATIGSATMPRRHARMYGVLLTVNGLGGRALSELRDKPAILPRGRYQVSVGRMLLPPRFAVRLASLAPSAETNEVQITDALANLSAEARVLVAPLKGRYYDCGQVDGWLKANRALARHGARYTWLQPARLITRQF